MVAMGWPRGCQGMLKGAKGVPKKAQYDPKDGQREPKGKPKTPQREAWDGLQQPWGDPGAAWGDRPENEPGEAVFPVQKRTGFSRPRGGFFDDFRSNFRFECSLIFDAIFAAKLPSKSQPKGGQGRQMPGQSLH